jgi:hypothetical protein
MYRFSLLRQFKQSIIFVCSVDEKELSNIFGTFLSPSVAKNWSKHSKNRIILDGRRFAIFVNKSVMQTPTTAKWGQIFLLHSSSRNRLFMEKILVFHLIEIALLVPATLNES